MKRNTFLLFSLLIPLFSFAQEQTKPSKEGYTGEATYKDKGKIKKLETHAYAISEEGEILYNEPTTNAYDHRVYLYDQSGNVLSTMFYTKAQTLKIEDQYQYENDLLVKRISTDTDTIYGFPSTYTYKYHSNGVKSEEFIQSTKNESHFQRWSYDENGNLTQVENYNSWDLDGDLQVDHTLTKSNYQNGHKLESEIFSINPDGELWPDKKVDFESTPTGQLLKRTSYSYKGDHFEWTDSTRYKYENDYTASFIEYSIYFGRTSYEIKRDDLNRVVHMKRDFQDSDSSYENHWVYDKMGSIIKTTSTQFGGWENEFFFTYDEKGNWVQMIKKVDGKYSEARVRKITYYN